MRNIILIHMNMNFKKIRIGLPLVLTAAFIFSLLPSISFAASFSDVPENTVNYNAIEYLKAKGVISGYSDGTFQPDKAINRAEALKVLMLATATPLDSKLKLTFPDVAESDWFYKYVQKAYELKTVEGYPDGKFKPANNINIAESLKIIVLAFNEQSSAALTADPYPDVLKTDWYAIYAYFCKTKQLITPMDDGKLHADREITRGEFAQIIYRLMYIKEKKLDKFPIDIDWPSYTHPTDHYVIRYPFDWQILEAGKNTIFWKQDKGNGQLSFERVFPNGAKVVAYVDLNEDRIAFDEYVKKLNYYTTGVTQKMTLNGYPFAVITIDNGKFNDYYFELPNKTILIIYTEAGNGPYSPELANELRYMIGSVKYTEATTGLTARDKFLSQVRAKILVKGAGQDAIALFKELVLIQTDSIGIGTGPVDYYYSADYDVTLKIERNSSTLLAISDGKTTSF
jgi:hypothetical protein